MLESFGDKQGARIRGQDSSDFSALWHLGQVSELRSFRVGYSVQGFGVYAKAVSRITWLGV